MPFICKHPVLAFIIGHCINLAMFGTVLYIVLNLIGCQGQPA